MIRRRLSAALLPLDSFTGETLGRRVLCKLDGVPLNRPIWKRDGWLVLSDLPPGEHRIVFRCPGFEDATVSLSGDVRTEEAVLLNPGESYAFPPKSVFLSLTLSGLPDAQARVFAGMLPSRPLKLMRETKAEDSSVEMFVSGPAPRPGWFLLCGKATEAAFFRRVTAEGAAETALPLTQPHSRGETLIPARSFLMTAGNAVKLPFRNPGTAYLFCRGKLKTVELRTGEKSSLEWNLEA